MHSHRVEAPEGAGSGATRDTRRTEVERIDVVCGPEAARARLTSLVSASLEHGLRFDPRAVTVVIRWLDRDRVRLDVHWHGSTGSASSPVTPGDVAATIATLDTVAHQWGFTSSAGDPVHWMILDVASSSD